MYKLYVIPGSHACRSAMLMLEQKGLPYRRVDIVTLMHPVVVRLRGFDAGGQTRAAGGKRTPGLRLGDRLGTVPALAVGGERGPPHPRGAPRPAERPAAPPALGPPPPPPRPSSRPTPRPAAGSRRSSGGRTRRSRWPPAGSPARR